MVSSKAAAAIAARCRQPSPTAITPNTGAWPRHWARAVPASQAQVRAYFAAQQPQLRMDARSREVLAVLAGVRLPVPLPGVSRDLFLAAGAALLPDWAAPLLGRDRRGRRLRAALAARLLRGSAPLFRAALGDGIAARACQRMGRDPQSLLHWPA